VVNIIIFGVFGLTFFGYETCALLVVFLLLQVFSIKITSIQSGIQKEYLRCKDERTKQVKSVLNCLPLITVFGLEAMAFLRVAVERVKEINQHISINVKRSWLSLFSWGSAYLSFAAMIACMFWFNKSLTYAFVVPASKLLMLLFYTTGCIPRATEAIFNTKVSIERMQRFLNIREIDPIWTDGRDKTHQAQSSFAGNDLTELELLSSQMNQTTSNILLQDMSVSWNDSTDKAKNKQAHVFKLDNVSLEAETGQLVALIGSVGSGKSSILSAVFNEMQLLNPQASSKTVDPDCIYLPQKPWILNKSIKQNVVLNKRWDKQLFERSLQVAHLSQDVDQMKDKAETQVGKKGEKLSGGQRWRLSLARAYYQGYPQTDAANPSSSSTTRSQRWTTRWSTASSENSSTEASKARRDWWSPTGKNSRCGLTKSTCCEKPTNSKPSAERLSKRTSSQSAPSAPETPANQPKKKRPRRQRINRSPPRQQQSKTKTSSDWSTRRKA